MTILVTGTTGFIGRHLVEKLTDCLPVIREGESSSCNKSYIVSSIDDETNWNGALDRIDSIIHLAGIAHTHNSSPEAYQKVNVDGTLHLAREAAKRGVRRMVFVSSIGVNGTNTNDSFAFTPNSFVHPHNPYAESKYLAEMGLLDIAKETALEVVIVRPTLVYGTDAPGNFGSLVKLVSKLPFLPFGLINNQRDFISVHNLVDLLICCAQSSQGSGCIFLASDGQTSSIRDFTDSIATGLGKKVLQLPVPTFLFRFVGKLTGKSTMVEQLVGDLTVDSSNVKSILGWTPPYTIAQSMQTLSEKEND